MSVCREPVLSLDDIAELKVDAEVTPDDVAKYSCAALLEKRKAVEGRYPQKPGFFDKNKVAARELYCTRYPAQAIKAKRRVDEAEKRYKFFMGLKKFDAAVARIDFELSVCLLVAFDSNCCRN